MGETEKIVIRRREDDHVIGAEVGIGAKKEAGIRTRAEIGAGKGTETKGEKKVTKGVRIRPERGAKKKVARGAEIGKIRGIGTEVTAEAEVVAERKEREAARGIEVKRTTKRKVRRKVAGIEDRRITETRKGVRNGQPIKTMTVEAEIDVRDAKAAKIEEAAKTGKRVKGVTKIEMARRARGTPRTGRPRNLEARGTGAEGIPGGKAKNDAEVETGNTTDTMTTGVLTMDVVYHMMVGVVQVVVMDVPTHKEAAEGTSKMDLDQQVVMVVVLGDPCTVEVAARLLLTTTIGDLLPLKCIVI